MSDQEALVKAVGREDAEAVTRLLGNLPFSVLKDAASRAEQDWVEWARATAVLQRWVEARAISVDVHRKLGYLSCAVEAARVIPSAMRPRLSETVSDFLESHGLSVDDPQ